MGTKYIGFEENWFDEDNDDIENNDLLGNLNKENIESKEDENDGNSENLKLGDLHVIGKSQWGIQKTEMRFM